MDCIENDDDEESQPGVIERRSLPPFNIDFFMTVQWVVGVREKEWQAGPAHFL